MVEAQFLSGLTHALKSFDMVPIKVILIHRDIQIFATFNKTCSVSMFGVSTVSGPL